MKRITNALEHAVMRRVNSLMKDYSIELDECIQNYTGDQRDKKIAEALAEFIIEVGVYICVAFCWILVAFRIVDGVADLIFSIIFK